MSRSQQKKAIQRVAYGTLVRNRRLAQAIARLGADYAFEARALARSMLEIEFNYLWIRLKSPNTRAKSFLMFTPLEQLTIISAVGETLDSVSSTADIEYLTRRRDKLRRLYFRTNNEGKSWWATSWADVTKFEARLLAVQQAHTKASEKTDQFLYGIYRWYSGCVHGSPLSFMDLLGPSQFGARALAQPEPDPGQQVTSATLMLLTTLRPALTDLAHSKATRLELNRLEDKFALMSGYDLALFAEGRAPGE